MATRRNPATAQAAAASKTADPAPRTARSKTTTPAKAAKPAKKSPRATKATTPTPAETGAAEPAPGKPTRRKPTRVRVRVTQPTPAVPPASTGSAATPGTRTAPSNDATNDSVLRAVRAGSDLTAADVMDATGLSRSRVSRALTRLAADGRVARTRGGGGGLTRVPDRWNATAPGPAQPQDRTVPTTGPTPAKSITRGPERAKGRRPAARPQVAAGEPNLVTNTIKLAPGQLHRLVADHFASRPDAELTAGEVGRALGRSSGAVRNAADKFVKAGDLRLVSVEPRRYALAHK